MKVLFLYTNINGFHADGFGDGIAQIMSVTKNAGHDIRNKQIFKKSEYSQLAEMIRNYNKSGQKELLWQILKRQKRLEKQ